jgi:lantibiotic leader peptide-processing serine protease
MRRGVLATIWIAGLLFGALMPLAAAETGSSQRYLVVLAGQQTGTGFVADGAVSTAKGLVAAAGGTVANDLSRQIGVFVVESTNPALAETLRASSLIEEVGNDFSWKAFDSTEEALAGGATVIQDEGGGPEPSSDTLEPLQWSMQQIRTEQAHAIQAGRRAVDVGILDTGIDATHADFQDPLGGTNVDCARGRNSIAFLPGGPGVGTPAPCVDNQFHGTHVAGIVAAQANGVGVVGVAPNVTLVPVKVCDASGFCYASAAVDGITYGAISSST